MVNGIEQNNFYAINWNKLLPEVKTTSEPQAVFPPMIEASVTPEVNYSMIFFEEMGKSFQNFMQAMNAQIENMFPKVLTFPNKAPLEPIVLQPGNNYELPAAAEASFDKFMEYVLKDEGGFVNNKKDPGGATNMGIRKDLYEKILGPISLEDFKNLTKEQAKEYYYKYYWVPSGAKELAEKGNAKLAYTLLDTAIHHGVGKAKNFLVRADGDAEKLLDVRLATLKKSKNWGTFGRGWTNRLNRIEGRVANMPELIKTPQDKFLFLNA